MKMNASSLQNAPLPSLLLGKVSFSLKELVFPLSPKRRFRQKENFILQKG